MLQTMSSQEHMVLGPLNEEWAHVIQSDGEAIETAQALAAYFRLGAAERDCERILPFDEIEKFSQSGLWAITVPKEYGGADVSSTTLARVISIICAADPSIGQIPQNHFTSVDDIRLEGTEAQKQFYFNRILKGDRIGSAYSEARSKTVQEIQTSLTRTDKGGFLLNGEKFYCTGALFSDWLPVRAVDSDGQEVTAIVSSKAEGITMVDDWSGFGQRTTASGTTTFKNVRVDESNLVYTNRTYVRPTNSGAFAQNMQAAIDLGIATEAIDETIAFVRSTSRAWVDANVERASDDPLTIYDVGELEYRLHSAEALLERAGRVLDESNKNMTLASCAAASIAVAEARIATTEIALLATNKLFELAGTRSTAGKFDLDRHWRNARTHTLHDPVRWKYHAVGNYYLNNKNPNRHNWI